MTVTPPDVMRHVRNHFVAGRVDGDWQVTDGQLTPGRFCPGEWIAITGDGPRGVYQLDECGRIPGLSDAAWTGRVYLLTPPADFLRLCREIADWVRAHPDPSVTSERFGEYSRTTAGQGWQQVFAIALQPYQRMYAEVPWRC